MTVRTAHTEGLTWFVTFTCYKWISLFDISDSYDQVYKWFYHLRERQLAEVSVFVIMPNHVHLILHLNNEKVKLNTIVSNGKRFMAYEMVKRLERDNVKNVLVELAGGVSSKERLKGQKHKAFETSFDAKKILTEEFLIQKMDYIHYNPVRGKWNLAEDYLGYEHSSAAFYETGEAIHFKPVPWQELF